MTLEIVETFFHVWPQWIACSTVTLLSVSIGLVIGWTSPYLALLTSDKAPFLLNETEASWVASFLPFGRLFGAVTGSVIMGFQGSKRALLSAGIPLTIGWICTIFANSALWLYTFRFLAGICFGMFYSCFSIFIGEIAAPNVRGALVSMVVNGMPLGSLLGTIIGSQMSMTGFGIISTFVSIFYMSVLPLLPQSPHYHVRHNNIEKAKQTIKWYHRKANVDEELQLIVEFVQATQSTTFREKFKQMMEKKNRQAFSLTVVLFVFMQLSGLNTITFYMEIIVRSAKVTVMSPANVVIMCNAFGIIVGWIGVYLIDRFGRRILIIASCTHMIVSMVLLGLHFLMLEQNVDPKSIEWQPILSMMLYMMMAIGLIPVPSTVLSEVFPDDLKSFAGFAASMTSASCAFICSKTYQPLVDLLSEKYVFWIYALIIAIFIVYLYFILPETKGKNFQEIQKMLLERSLQSQRRSVLRRTEPNT